MHAHIGDRWESALLLKHTAGTADLDCMTLSGMRRTCLLCVDLESTRRQSGDKTARLRVRGYGLGRKQSDYGDDHKLQVAVDMIMSVTLRL
jgi:hypothetical protein